MAKLSLLFASISGFISVALGAFGAHALKAHLEGLNYTNVFETAVRYQFYHSLLLFVVSFLLILAPVKWFRYSSLSLMAGILLFSASLYVLAMTGIRSLGMITPFGGVFLLLGWVFLALGINQSYPQIRDRIKG